MTDIETLRQAVIDAARKLMDIPAGSMIAEAMSLGSWHALHGAVNALDAAMRPDPWALLEAVIDAGGVDPGLDNQRGYDAIALDERIEEALRWHKEHPDE